MSFLQESSETPSPVHLPPAALDILELQRAGEGSGSQPRRPLRKGFLNCTCSRENKIPPLVFFPLGAVPITQTNQVDGTGTPHGWVPWVPTGYLPRREHHPQHPALPSHNCRSRRIQARLCSSWRDRYLQTSRTARYEFSVSGITVSAM